MTDRAGPTSSDMAAIVEAVKREIDKWRAEETGGCFRPDDMEQDGECADGDCYCGRFNAPLAKSILSVALTMLEQPTPKMIDDALTVDRRWSMNMIPRVEAAWRAMLAVRRRELEVVAEIRKEAEP